MTSSSREAAGRAGGRLKVAPQEPALTAIVRDVASVEKVPFRPLQLQALLHLPRIADRAGWVLADDARSEASRLSLLVPPMPEWTSLGIGEKTGWHVRGVSGGVARPVLERFHYLRSFRESSQHFGLYDGDDDQPVALASTSSNDVALLGQIAQRHDVEPAQARVVSRVFCFDDAPPNAISMLLGHVGRLERRVGTRMLLTYVNPNVGFTGGSYRASNWSAVGEEPGTAYDYVDGTYVTVRALRKSYGTADPAELRQRLGSRYEQSQMPLLPLQVFAVRLDSGRRMS
jgi:hypothetical protein